MERPKKKLGVYRDKRSPAATNEPFGDEAPLEPEGRTLGGAFVVHLHDATRRHYDLRLEIGGVLASFAVPRGPSLDPDAKNLAVKTEDHPIEYLEFEDVIPEAQYGAGPMIAWDRGWVDYLEGPAEEEIPRGKLDLRLRGMKLRGRFALVKLKKSAKGDEWLLFKKKDAHADPARDVVSELPRSVLSGLTVEELERRDAIGAAWEREALGLGERGAAADLFAPGRPPLAVARAGVPSREDGLVYDAELDGVRVLATRDGDLVSLRRPSESGSQRGIEAFYPDVVRALRALPLTRIVIDGELCAFDESGRPSATLLARRAERIARGEPHRAVAEIPVVLVASDLLVAGAADLREAPLERRRALLEKVLPPLGFLRAAPPLEGALARIVASCKALGIAGVVAKRRDGRYDASDGGWVRIGTGAPRTRVEIVHETQDKVVVSNRRKVFFPEDGLTKGDLCDYYAAIAEAILPHLAARPVILVRYPDGIAGKSFYQWNVPPGMPPWVRTTSLVDEEGTPKRGFLVDDAATLLYIANLACIPVHILACRVPDLAQADFFTIDFDVKQSELRHAITLAKTLRELLDAIGLPGFPKTSGQSGLHVLVPLGPGQSFDTACALAELVGKLLVERHPEIATMERIVKRRGAKVYVDTGQTGASRAIVAPYSVRAVPGARVSTPLAWDEVSPDLDPGRFTIATVPARFARLGDPMRGMLEARPDVARAVAALDALVRRAR